MSLSANRLRHSDATPPAGAIVKLNPVEHHLCRPTGGLGTKVPGIENADRVRALLPAINAAANGSGRRRSLRGSMVAATEW